MEMDIGIYFKSYATKPKQKIILLAGKAEWIYKWLKKENHRNA